MTTSEVKTKMHAGSARRLLDEADDTLMRQDLPLTGEKLWNATLDAVKALCASRGWEYTGNDYVQFIDFVKTFSVEKSDETIKLGFLIASHCHANAQYDWMEFGDLDENRVIVRRAVEKILAEIE